MRDKTGGVREKRESRQGAEARDGEERKQRVLAQLPGSWKTLVEKFTIKTTEGGNSLTNNFLQE